MSTYTIKNVIIVGVSFFPSVICYHSTFLIRALHTQATGNLGPSVLKALQENGQFNVTVLTRNSSKSNSSLPPNTRVITADYDSIDSLTAAFKGQDAVVATNSPVTAESQQELLVDAAINAGVKRFISSEFGSNTLEKKSVELAVFARRIAARNYLEKKAAEGKITWTAIACGGFLEWGMFSVSRTVCFSRVANAILPQVLTSGSSVSTLNKGK